MNSSFFLATGTGTASLFGIGGSPVPTGGGPPIVSQGGTAYSPSGSIATGDDATSVASYTSPAPTPQLAWRGRTRGTSGAHTLSTIVDDGDGSTTTTQ